MGNVRPVCIYQQYYCCPSHKDCRLYHLCSQLPKKPFVPNSTTYKVFNAVPLDRAEIRKHQEQYKYYNLLWGDLKSKVSDYCKRNHEHKMEYQRQYRAKKNPNKYNFDSVLFEGLCDKDCENCKYDDCILPTWNNKQEYDALYYQKNSEVRKQKVSNIIKLIKMNERNITKNIEMNTEKKSYANDESIGIRIKIFLMLADKLKENKNRMR